MTSISFPKFTFSSKRDNDTSRLKNHESGIIDQILVQRASIIEDLSEPTPLHRNQDPPRGNLP